MNNLFETSFKVMESREQRKQTTRGIWASYISKEKVVVFDIEGADSRERWEEKNSYERKSALFGLVISNVLIINIWVNDVGRYSGANYEILKVILELNLQYFNRETPKQIIFVIRDFSDRENFSHIKDTILQDVDMIWKEIKKPGALENIPFEKLFLLNIVSIRSLIYEKDNFVSDVQALKSILVQRNSHGYLFKDLDFKNIPLNGLNIYMSQIWEAVRTNKDVNIPNQKIIVSNYRCNEVRNETMQIVKRDIVLLKQELEKNSLVNIKERYERILCSSLKSYKASTVNYDEIIVQNTCSELHRAIVDEFEQLFKEQSKKIADDLILSLHATITKISASTDTDIKDSILVILDESSMIQQQFKIHLSELPLNIFNKEELLKYFELKSRNSISSFYSSSINSLLKSLIRAFSTEIDHKIFLTFNNLSTDSWAEFNVLLTRKINSLKSVILELRDSFEDLRPLISEELIESFIKDLIFDAKKSLRHKKFYISEYLFENFKSRFDVNENGVRRNWRQIEDSEIDRLFQEARKSISTNLTVFDSQLVLGADGETIIDIEESKRYKKKFESEINDFLESTYNKKYNRNSLQKVPWWLWVILAYFMHDNVIAWMKSPTVFLLIIISSVCIGYLYASNKLQYILQTLMTLKNLFFPSKISVVSAPPKRSETFPNTRLSSGSKKEDFEYR